MKTYLCYSTPGTARVPVINDKTIVDPNTKETKYAPNISHLTQRLMHDKFYTLILSTFDLSDRMGGSLTIESHQPVAI